MHYFKKTNYFSFAISAVALVILLPRKVFQLVDFLIYTVLFFIIVVLFLEILTRQKEIKDLKEKHHNIAKAFNNKDIVMWYHDSNLNMPHYSSGFKDLFGYCLEDFRLDPELYKKIIFREDLKKVVSIKTTLQSGKSISNLLRTYDLDGNLRWTKNFITPYLDKKGNLDKMVGLSIDVTNQKVFEEELRKSEERYHNLLKVCPISIVVQQNDYIVFSNDAALKTLGINESDLKMNSILDFVQDEYKEIVHSQIRRALEGNIVDYHEYMVKRSDYKTLYIEGKVLAVQFAGKPAIMNVFVDITKRKSAEKMITQIAYHDVLTGLPNRNLLISNLSKNISKADRYEQRFALMFIDLDKFKNVNDSLGHSKGDILLKMAANRLGSAVREYDHIYRYGGDEFIITLEDIDEDEISLIARRIMKELNKPFLITNHQANISPSIGISIYPEDGSTVDTLINNADKAMYKVKETGKNNFGFYNQSIKL